MPSSVCDWSLERLSVLSVLWLKYHIENSSNDVFEFGLQLCTISNGVVSLMLSQPGTWFSIIASCRTAKYQNTRLTCFYVINARTICIIVRHVHSSNPFEDWRPAGSAVMLEPFNSIHWTDVHQSILCWSWSETCGVGVPSLLWIVLIMKLLT